MNKQYAQGDVLLIQVDALPGNLKSFNRENGKLVLALGEVTGHHHRIEEPTTEAWVDENDQVFIQVRDLINEVKLLHEEHSAITLPPGNYKVINKQRQFVAPRANEQTASEVRNQD